MTDLLESHLDVIFDKKKWSDKFNITTYALAFFTTLLAPFFLGNVIYVSRLLKYRCFIPDCDLSYENANYDTDWLHFVVPFHDSNPEKCSRYDHIDGSTTCSPESFNTNKTIRCDDKFVFAEKYRTITQDFNIYCNENNWQLTLPSSVSFFGTLLSFIVNGIISDRFGRRTTIIFGLLFSGVVGILKSFSISYIMYVILEFIGQVISGGVYVVAFTYGSEQTKIENRVTFISILGVVFSCGDIILAALSWSVYSWRVLLRLIFCPCFLAFLFYWISPESVKWLMAKKRYDEAERNLNMCFQSTAKNDDSNNRIILISMESLEMNVKETSTNKEELRKFFSNRLLICRFLISVISAFTIYLIYYGSTFYVVILDGNIFVNLIFLYMGEVPVSLLSALILNRFNRRFSMSTMFILMGLSNVCCVIATLNNFSSFVFIIIAKLFTSAGFVLMHIVMQEIFPTTIRGTLVSASLTLGYLGVQLAVQVPILAIYWKILPPIIFGAVSFFASILIPFLPETRGKPLPENVDIILKNSSKNSE